MLFLFHIQKIDLKDKSSTSVARAKFNKDNVFLKIFFEQSHLLNSGYHFGSRIVIKDKNFYITAGERGKGMIAQDPTQHPGSIIRINLDGSIPKDNPKFINQKNWLQKFIKLVLETRKECHFHHLIIKYI